MASKILRVSPMLLKLANGSSLVKVKKQLNLLLALSYIVSYSIMVCLRMENLLNIV